MKDQPLKASINASASYRLGDPILITFEIENIGSETYQLLKWGTPLEQEVTEDFLIIQRNGEPIPYDGVFVSRGDPSPQSYVMISPGEKLKETVDISIAYPIYEPGDYTATLKASLYDVFPIVGTEKQASRSQTDFEPRHLSPSTVQFHVFADREAKLTPRLTSGEMAREAEKQAKRTSKTKAPNFNGGTSAQQADTIIAHNNTQHFADLCASQLSVGSVSSDALYRTWFGAFDQSRCNMLIKNYTDIANVLLSEQVTYDFTGRSPWHSCKPDYLAFTYKGMRTVWICSLYLSVPQIGFPYSKFRTLIHEWTHAVSFTDDHGYGESYCQSVATNEPEKAVKNADNLAFFAAYLVQSKFFVPIYFMTTMA